jgi:hypothetical protein
MIKPVNLAVGCHRTLELPLAFGRFKAGHLVTDGGCILSASGDAAWGHQIHCSHYHGSPDPNQRRGLLFGTIGIIAVVPV